MPATPDARWTQFQEPTEPGLVKGSIVSFDGLERVAASWPEILPAELDHGTASLLRTARSLFVHAWFDYEFLAIACLTALQAVEAAVRDLYPEASKVPFARLVQRARTQGVLSEAMADLADTAVELRNLVAHPEQLVAFSPGMAESVLENSHRLVAVLAASLRERDDRHKQPPLQSDE
ncbi:MAG: hypothetical protein F2692_00075 [Actinobacteria bacterium]|uniref:Unannotated protein n=1 Tax=freshwater metagenome TaxID=449393 RepID=A0A6J7QTV4_9ZZZZ|nr:hypothetical protein [Actinomycetota bacterium]MSY70370.1 hypothetical protein [Actinomycetota bacterium]